MTSARVYTGSKDEFEQKVRWVAAEGAVAADAGQALRASAKRTLDDVLGGRVKFDELKDGSGEVSRG